MDLITTVIPAYNEADRIGNILNVLKDVPFIHTIFVVNDGSKDDTKQVVENFIQLDPRIILINNPKNVGKGQSIYNARAQATTPYLLMLDADLKGLTINHVEDLCRPVLSDHADMTIGLFKKGHWSTDLAHWFTPWLSGQRCLKFAMMDQLSHEAASGYGIETAMTVAAHQFHWKVQQVSLLGMSHPPNELHRGSIKGLLNRIKMYAHIVRAWYVATAKLPEGKSKPVDPG